MDHVDRLFVNLKILASVLPQQKINTIGGDHILIENGYWMPPSISRWVQGDNRHNTVRRLGEVLEEAGRLLEKEGSRLEMEGRLKKQLRLTRTGLENLRRTYEDDATILAHFDVLLEKLDSLAGQPEEVVTDGSDDTDH